MKEKKPNGYKSGKLLKIVVKECGEVLMELLPTKQNEEKATRMSCMGEIEVVRVYEE